MSAVPTILKDNPFLKDNKDYECRLDPLPGYMEQTVTSVVKAFGLTKEEAKGYVKEIIKKKKPNIPMVEYRGREKNGDKVDKSIALNKYITDNIANNNIIVPSFTVYTKTKKSLHRGYVLSNLKKRTIEKNLSKQALRDGDMEKFSYHDVLQKVRKTFNNSLSGAYASKSTMVFNPPAHYTLTTITRGMASIGNGITEMVMMGNRHYTCTNTILNHLTATVTNVDLEAIGKLVRIFDLNVPTPTEILGIINYSSDLYYKDLPGEKIIMKFLNGLNKAERAAVSFVNDFYQLREFNPKLVRGILTGLGRPYMNNLDQTTATLDNAPGWLLDVVHMVCKDSIKGKKVDYSKMVGTNQFKQLTGTTERMINTLDEFSLLFKSLFRTTVMPIDMVDIKQLTRRAIVVSDTDSTCGSYTDYVTWFFGENKFNQDATGITGAVMMIVTQAMGHYIKQLAGNMNAGEEFMDTLEMKNEFYWELIVAPLITKHYYAGINIKEGYVYEDFELEIKGVHFIASSLPPEYKKRTKELYKEIIKTVTSGEKVDLEGYIVEIANIEKAILDSLNAGEVNLLKTGKIKSEDSYKDDWKGSTYYHYKLWNEVYGPKYGPSSDVPISVYTINTTLDSKGKIKRFIEGIKDTEVKDRMVKFYSKHQKGSLGVFHLPVDVGVEKGIPDEIMGVMDYTGITTNLLMPFYKILATMGYHVKPNTTLTDLGY